MVRSMKLGAAALALMAGGAAFAEPATGTRGESGDAAAGSGTAMPADADIKGVYSTKSMMGISTGQPANAASGGADQPAAEESGDRKTASD